ncbi:uncharacterized protein G2W53_008061 [Senna tora]|uniref:Uncharacterized protein n=1 Tax=Senna tora TaxID=362788 RepID=A0A835CEV6_9FABA|nr:uncharacterized protein G2W53_008061 [Senna tora]
MASRSNEGTENGEEKARENGTENGEIDQKRENGGK